MGGGATGSLVLDIWGSHGVYTVACSIHLTAGDHRIYGMMYQGSGPCRLTVKYRGPDTGGIGGSYALV